MKTLMLLLGLSLAANTAFLYIHYFKPVPVSRKEMTAPPPPKPEPSKPASLSTTQLSALSSSDVAQLKAAGFSDDLARSIVIGRASLRLQENYRKAASSHKGPYWKTPIMQFGQSKEQRAEMMRAQREYAAAVRAAGGEDFFTDSRYDYLPGAKREQIRRVEQDYSEMQSEIYENMSGIQLPSDQEKLRLLHQERERDIIAVLSPDELEQYNLHSSPTAQTVRARFGDGLQTEEDYKKIFALQKAFDDQYSPQEQTERRPSQESMAARRDAELKLQADIRTALGEANFAAIQRATDQEYKTLTSVAKRLNLPPTIADTVFAARDGYAAQSQEINKNASLTPQDRGAQLKSLAGKARTELQATLGSEGAEAYAQRANWLQFLNNGSAFSTDLKDAPQRGFIGMTAYPIRPPTTKPAPKG